MPILFRETKGDIRVLYNGRLPRLQNSLDGFCQSSVRVGEVVSRIYFEVKNELHMELAVTVGTYEKLAETFGADSTLTIFRKQVNAVRK